MEINCESCESIKTKMTLIVPSMDNPIVVSAILIVNTIQRVTPDNSGHSTGVVSSWK